VVDEKTGPVTHEDPVVTAFLAFIEKDLKDYPGRRIRLSKPLIARALRLTKGVKVGDNERLPEDVTF
jgi:antitoxin PrlF